MSRSIVRGNTVRFSKEDTVKTAKGEDMKVLYFTVADRSKYAQKDGKGNVSYKTKGFWFCKALGDTAEQLKKFFDLKDENGKLMSRKIYIEADAQQFVNHKEVEVELKVPVDKLCAAMGISMPGEMAGKSATLKKKEVVEYIDVVHTVTHWEFDDNKPEEDNEVEIIVDDSATITIDC